MPKIRRQGSEPSGFGEPTFARHETFAPRYGWLKKGFDAVQRDPAVFSRPDAALQLGVGKNMARAIRYWVTAFDLVHEVPRGLQPTTFGKRLLGPDGLDPYLEDLGSLWLLHWRLLRKQGAATAWRYAFYEYPHSEFAVDDLSGSMEDVVRRRYPTARAATSSLRKDATCIVQMYGSNRQEPGFSEESIRSPFTQLQLLTPAFNPRQFSFRTGSKPGLTAPLVVGLCADFMSLRESSSVPVASLLRAEGSPGLALRLSESALYGYLEEASALMPIFQLGDAAGVIQLSTSGLPRAAALDAVHMHFTSTGGMKRSVA